MDFSYHLGVERALLLTRQADVIAAMSTDALRGTIRHLHPSKFVFSFDRCHMIIIGLHGSRPHTGQNVVAQRMRSLLNSSIHPSAIFESHANCGKVQDAYSIRCIPQVNCDCIHSFTKNRSRFRFMVSHGIRWILYKR